MNAPEDQLRVTVLLVLVARKWRSLLDEQLRPEGQSSARMEALSAIRNSPDGSTQVNIARRLKIEGPTLTRMLAMLEKDGLVERRTGTADRRSKQLLLTLSGQQALQEIVEIADPLRARLLGDVDEETMATLTAVLEDLLRKLEDGLPGEDG